MPTKRLDSLSPRLPRVDRYDGKTCAVPGCIRPTRPMSRYCRTHNRRNDRNRSPTAHLPKRSDLVPWERYAETALVKWGLQHDPAVQSLLDWLRLFLALDLSDVAHKPTRRELQRIQAGAPEPLRVLVRIMAVHALRYLGRPGSADYGDSTFWAAVGHAIARSVKQPTRTDWQTGKRIRQRELPGVVAENIGAGVHRKIGHALIALWTRIEAETSQRCSLEQRTLLLIETEPYLRGSCKTPKERRRVAQNVVRQAQGLPSAAQLAAEATKAAAEEAEARRLLQSIAADNARLALLNSRTPKL